TGVRSSRSTQQRGASARRCARARRFTPRPGSWPQTPRQRTCAALAHRPPPPDIPSQVVPRDRGRFRGAPGAARAGRSLDLLLALSEHPLLVVARPGRPLLADALLRQRQLLLDGLLGLLGRAGCLQVPAVGREGGRAALAELGQLLLAGAQLVGAGAVEILAPALHVETELAGEALHVLRAEIAAALPGAGPDEVV